MDFKITVVIDVAQLPKLIHKMTHAGARCADHVRERLLAYPRDDRHLPPLFAEIRQQQQSPEASLSLGGQCRGGVNSKTPWC
jgi:hypothetical protein